jgi:glutamate N-acetyltransferase/amino-acid N-acetyltransferase
MSVTVPKGFLAAGVVAGIKDGRAADLALVATESRTPAPATAVFTSNRAAAAPVLVSRDHLAATGGRAAAVVINSGNANAATGQRGRDDALRMCAIVADHLGLATAEVLVCSTGLIGIPLPMDRLEKSIPELVSSLSPDEDAGHRATRAIMTTDTRPKQTRVDGDGFVVGGMAKGAAMLAPDMATMLAVLTTDAAVEGDALGASLGLAVRESFNALTVDGCTSTNDTVIVLASGAAGPATADDLTAVLSTACADLAEQMAADAEGGTKVARVRVEEAMTDGEAARAARKVAQSDLVRCSLHGGDPYWGRVVSELGSAGVGFDLDRVSVSYGGVEVCRGGVAVVHDETAVSAHMAGDRVEILCRLGLGQGRGSVTTVDLGPGYIDENKGTS